MLFNRSNDFSERTAAEAVLAAPAINKAENAINPILDIVFLNIIHTPSSVAMFDETPLNVILEVTACATGAASSSDAKIPFIVDILMFS